MFYLCVLLRTCAVGPRAARGERQRDGTEYCLRREYAISLAHSVAANDDAQPHHPTAEVTEAVEEPQAPDDSSWRHEKTRVWLRDGPRRQRQRREQRGSRQSSHFRHQTRPDPGEWRAFGSGDLPKRPGAAHTRTQQDGHASGTP